MPGIRPLQPGNPSMGSNYTAIAQATHLDLKPVYRSNPVMSKQPEDPGEKDDRKLFREAMTGVAPMTDERSGFYRRKRRPEPLNLPVGDEEKAEEAYGDLRIETGEFLDFQRPGVQNRVYRDLRRGVFEPEDTLDLHGMRVLEARTAFARFINQNLALGRRCVRIIHGKGSGSQDRQPVLKQKTNQWLQQNEQVLAFSSAPRWDGGTGVVYVLLSRKHRNTP